jgi:hypothetical protein
MSKFSITVDSRAYVHSGGTKYYRLASVSIVGEKGSVNALLTNYGPFKPAKGDLSQHKPMHGGTSGIEYFTNSTSLDNKLNSESIRRRGRGYTEDGVFRHQDTKLGATELEVQDILRGKLGLTTGHFQEIMTELGTKPAATGTPTMADLIDKAKAGLTDRHGIRPDGTRVAPKVAKAADDIMPIPPTVRAPPASKPEPDRGAIWGSW